MKVLLIHDTHQKWGGAEEHFFTIKKKLKEKGFIVRSLGFSNHKSNEEDSIIFPISNNKLINLYGKDAVDKFWDTYIINPGRSAYSNLIDNYFDDFPNVTQTAMPIRALKAHYYVQSDRLMKRLKF